MKKRLFGLKDTVPGINSLTPVNCNHNILQIFNLLINERYTSEGPWVVW